MQSQSQNKKPDFKTAQRTRPHATKRCVLEDGETTPDHLTLGCKGLQRASNQPAGLDLMGWGMLGLVQPEAQPMKGLFWVETRVNTTCQGYMWGKVGQRSWTSQLFLPGFCRFTVHTLNITDIQRTKEAKVHSKQSHDKSIVTQHVLAVLKLTAKSCNDIVLRGI